MTIQVQVNLFLHLRKNRNQTFELTDGSKAGDLVRQLVDWRPRAMPPAVAFDRFDRVIEDGLGLLLIPGDQPLEQLRGLPQVRVVVAVIDLGL